MASEDEPGSPGRDAVPRRPTPARPPASDAERERLQAEVAELHEQLAEAARRVDALAERMRALAERFEPGADG